MNWVARAKEALLGAPSPRSAVPAQPASASRWDSLSALSAAMNEALTGSPTTHPAVRALAEVQPCRRCLVLSDRQDAAHALIEALAGSPAALEVASGLLGGSSLGSRPGDDAYDAIFVETKGAPDGLRAALAQIQTALPPHGLLWVRHRTSERRTAPQRALIDGLLQQVPARWRLRETIEAEPSADRHGDDAAALLAALRPGFEILSQHSCGGTLLGPLLGSGCLDPAMADDAGGRDLLAAFYRIERELIARGEVEPGDVIVLARPRRDPVRQISSLLERHASPLPHAANMGIAGSLPDWIAFNLGPVLESARAARLAAPFPPTELMHRTTGLGRNEDFAQHGADLVNTLALFSPKPLASFESLLDFGVGVGRLARYFKGFPGRYVGVDIDAPNLDWIAANLPWVEPRLTQPGAPLPFEDGSFDGVVSISVFTHIDRAATEFYIDELYRVTRPGALLFLSLHGQQALARALTEEAVGRLVGITPQRLQLTSAILAREGFDFAEQATHLSTETYRYGTTFMSQAGAEAIFGRRFRVLGLMLATIHLFQDLIVLERP